MTNDTHTDNNDAHARDRERRLSEALGHLDEDTLGGLEELATNEPDLLREMIADVGYLSSTDSHTQAQTNRESQTLTRAQRRLRGVVSEMEAPRTAEEVIELLNTDYPQFIEEYQSAKHRPWLSTQLNELVSAGECGRFRDGRVIRYVPTITEAIRHWALHHNHFIEEIDHTDARQISDDTGMPAHAVRSGIEQLTEGTDHE